MTSQRTLLALVTLLASGFACAATMSVAITPTADGDVQVFGGDDVDTSDSILSITQSGGLARNAILEFDLTALGGVESIDGARIDFTLTRFISNTGGNPSEIDLFTYLGDGVVDISDFDAPGLQVVDTQVESVGTDAGDVLSFVFSDVSTLEQALLADGLLTVRFETDSFASINIAALENGTFEAATLTVDFTPVPLPASLLFLTSALASTLLRRSRR